jgi:hypothetical protein
LIGASQHHSPSSGGTFLVHTPLSNAVHLRIEAKELTTLSAAGLPVGQPTGCEFYAPLAATCFPASARPVPLRDEILKLGGWAITAFAVSFGAPFWFEALSRLGSLRNAGTPPEPT